MSSIRVIVPPVTFQNGRLEFTTADINFTDRSLENHRIVSISIDPNNSPKFGKCDPGDGWCSPPPERLAQLNLCNSESDCAIIINCKCQRKEILSTDDIASLEQTGHALGCPRVALEPLKITSKSPEIHHEIVQTFPEEKSDPAPSLVIEKPKDFCPEGGIPVSKLSSLTAYLQGASPSDLSFSKALKDCGFTDTKISEAVVLKELAQFHAFTVCAQCGTWANVASISNPRCLSCQSLNQGQ